MSTTPTKVGHIPRSAQQAERAGLRAHLDDWWTDGALRAIADLADTGRIFSCDDLRREPYSLPEPPHSSHWGALFSLARAEGLIRPVGYATSTTPTRRGGVLRLWRGGRRHHLVRPAA